MKSKDQILLEKAYSKILLETPDRTTDPSNKNKLNHNDFEARAFGFISAVEPITSSSWNFPTYTITLQDFPPEFKDKLYIADYHDQTHQNIFEQKILDDLMSASKGKIILALWNGIKTYDVSAGFNKELYKSIADENYNARPLLAPAGRIWPKSKVISFWVKEGEVTPKQLNMVFEAMDIPKEEADSFFIEFVGDKTPSKTVHDYTTSGDSIRNLSKEEEKRAAEAMAKAHVAAAVDTKDTAVNKVLDARKQAGIEADRRARLSGRVPGIETIQKSMTSESSEREIFTLEDALLHVGKMPL
jgi:hypothetical protein